MTGPDPLDRSAAPFYSPRRRTGLVLTGTGTAGAYHAGVLRALHEVGVKIDVVAGSGMGVIGALFTAIEGTQRLWETNGYWRGPAVKTLYAWHGLVRASVVALGLALAILSVPIAAVAVGLLVYPIDFVRQMMGLGPWADVLGAYLRLMQVAFAPEGFPTWLPRFVVLVLGVTGAVAVVTGWLQGRQRRRLGPFWWRV